MILAQFPFSHIASLRFVSNNLIYSLDIGNSNILQCLSNSNNQTPRLESVFVRANMNLNYQPTSCFINDFSLFNLRVYGLNMFIDPHNMKTNYNLILSIPFQSQYGVFKQLSRSVDYNTEKAAAIEFG